MLWVWISIRARCTTLCDKVCQWLETGRWFSPGPPVSSTNKTDRHKINEILLKMVLSTNKQTFKTGWINYTTPPWDEVPMNGWINYTTPPWDEIPMNGWTNYTTLPWDEVPMNGWINYTTPPWDEVPMNGWINYTTPPWDEVPMNASSLENTMHAPSGGFKGGLWGLQPPPPVE